MDEYSRVPVAEEEKNRSYYKYFTRELKDIPEAKQKVLEHPLLPEGDGLELEDRNKIFEPGILPDEMGVSKMKSGGYCFANHTEFPGADGEMLQWWFAWHPLECLRYSIWDPRDHYEVAVSDEDRIKLLDPQVSNLEKCQNVQHMNKESVLLGTDPIQVNISFKKPSDMGFEEQWIGTDRCSFFICGNVIKPEGGGLPIVLMHTARDLEDGCELRSRIWVGYQIIDGEVCCVAPENFELSEDQLRSQLQHHFFEFTNLAEILPALYAEEKDNWE